MQQERAAALQRALQPLPDQSSQGVESNPLMVAYQRHHQDIVQRQQGGEVDLRKVDAMIAVRLRVTGHTQTEIEQTLRQCAPTTRPQGESQDWADYASRTARYAFGMEGERQAVSLAKYKAQWEQLEGRVPVPTPTPEKRLSSDRSGPSL